MWNTRTPSTALMSPRFILFGYFFGGLPGGSEARTIGPRIASAAPERSRGGRPVARAVSQPVSQARAGARKGGGTDSASLKKPATCRNRWLGRQESWITYCKIAIYYTNGRIWVQWKSRGNCI